jgi:hypothetical protein
VLGNCPSDPNRATNPILILHCTFPINYHFSASPKSEILSLQMDNKRVHLKSGKDLLCLTEVFRAKTEDGSYKFMLTKFAYIDDEYVAYYGESTIRKKELSLQQREELL